MPSASARPGVGACGRRACAALARAVAAAGAALLAACDQTTAPAPASPLALSRDTVVLAWGDTLRLAVRDVAGRVAWASSDATVAPVDPAGLVRALRGGAARVTATAGERVGSTLVQVEARFTALAAGDAASCGVVPSGTVLCWGVPLDTVTGRAVYAERYTHSVTTPLPAPVSERVASVHVQRVQTLAADPVANYACAVPTAGAVRCWGAAEHGQHGIGITAPGTQVLPTPLGGPVPLASVALGYTHSCGLAADGAAYCWGSSLRGLGHAERNARCTGGGSRGTPCQTLPAPVATAERFAAIAPGLEHTCAVSRGGRLLCWGAGWAAGLAGGEFYWEERPTVIDTARYTQVAAGRTHACAVTATEELRCWGRNARGQLGRTVGDSAEHARPTAIDAPAGAAARLRVRRVSAGDDFTCAATTDGRIYCWGANDWGQLGDGTVASRSTPAPVPSTRRFVDVAAGTTHACALADDGAAICWGDNRRGQLGNGDRTASSLPVRVSAPR